MIALDTGTLQSRALNIQGCYMSGIGSHRVKEVLLGGKKNNRVFYCDVNLGFAIVHKENLDGTLVVADNEIVYDVFFGKVEVVLDDMEKPAN